MTRKEREAAIDIFEHNWTRIVNGDYTEEELNTAISKALEALKAEPCEDTISRKHLLSEIDDLMKSPWFNNGKDFYDGTMTHYGYVERKEAVEVVRDLCVKAEPPVTPKQRWIPVSERLPEEDGEYLLYGKVIEDEENYIFIGDYDSCAETFGYWQDYYDPSTLGYVDGELNEYASVIAWMPLPEPHKEGDTK